MVDLLQRAEAFATKAHEGQKRKYTGEPYVEHPRRVVAALRANGIEEEDVLAAAWLHDVIEDCDVLFDDLCEEFGALVATYVSLLTNVQRSAGNRANRNKIDNVRLATAPGEVQSIKLADIGDNLPSIIVGDKNFAVSYVREKADTVAILTKGNAHLRAIVENVINDYYHDQEAPDAVD